MYIPERKQYWLVYFTLKIKRWTILEINNKIYYRKKTILVSLFYTQDKKMDNIRT